MCALPTSSGPRDGLDPARARLLLRTADALARRGGGEAVQMKAVADGAGVAVATLYRYFPSKTHLLLALYHRRMEHLLGQVTATPAPGDTPGERVASVLIGEFRLAQREFRLAEALYAAVGGADRSAGESLAASHALHLQVLERAATRDGPPLAAQGRALLQVAAAVWGQELTGWLRGLRSPDEVVAQVRFAALLLDAPDGALPHPG